MLEFPKLIWATLIFVFLPISCTNEHTNNVEHPVYLNQHISAKTLIDSLGIAQEELTILIEKSNFTLSLIYNSKAIKQYPILV